jgi:hypothetical protein
VHTIYVVHAALDTIAIIVMKPECLLRAHSVATSSRDDADSDQLVISHMMAEEECVSLVRLAAWGMGE